MSVINMSPDPIAPAPSAVPDSIQETGAEAINHAELSDEELTELIDGPAEPESEETTPAPAPETPAKPAELTETDKLQKMVADSQSMIGRQANELGQLRKLVAEMTAKTNPPAPPVQPDEFFQNPVEATKRIVQETANAAKTEADTHRAAIVEARTQSAHFISAAAPQVMDLIPEMREIALSDGVPQDRVDAFAQDILSESPIVVVQLAKRAEALKRIRELESENKQLKAKPGQMLSRIAAASKARPSVSSGAGRSDAQVGESSMSKTQIAELSDAELEILLKRK